ncbi:hypothetical protein EBT16_02550 [bacterium]|nr:hypothetical protein [bacterium]
MRHFVFLLIAFSFWSPRSFSLTASMHEVEGLYDIVLVCEERSNPACAELNRKAKIAVLLTDDLLTVSVAYPEVSLSRYAFVSDELPLTNNKYSGHLMMSSSSAAPFAGIALDFFHEDTNTGHKVRIEGIIRDARFSKDVTFKGEQSVSFHTFQPPNVNLDAFKKIENVEGRYLAQGRNRLWVLNIRKGLSDSGPRYMAETTDMGSPDGTELASGERHYLNSIGNESEGVLELVAPLAQPGAFLKWVLWSNEKDTNKRTKLTGFFYSSTGVFSELSLEPL